MSYYARLRLALEVSSASDYSRPEIHGVESTATPAQHRVRDILSAPTTGLSYSLTFLTSIAKLIVYNTDATNYVTLAYTRAAGGAQSLKIPAGEVLVLPGGEIDKSVALTLTANTAAVVCEVSYLGS